MSIEEANYWNDPRTRAGMIYRGEVVEENGRLYRLVESDDGDIKVLCKKVKCDLCRGRGRYVNPSIDASGFQPEDPEDMEMYMGGVYDVTCNGCGGRGQELIVDRANNSEEMIKRYDVHIAEEQRYAAISAAERAMGA